MKDLLDLFKFVSGAIDYSGNVIQALALIDDTYCEDEVLAMFGKGGIDDDVDLKKREDVVWLIDHVDNNDPELKDHIGYSFLHLRKFLFDAGKVLKYSKEKIDLFTNNNSSENEKSN